MTNQIYKSFRKTVEKADKNADVWYAGYLWIDLTARQQKDIDCILRTKDFINNVDNANGKWHQFPNGLLFRRFED